MIVSIHQPNYLPWIGYFYKIAHSDVFVLLDDVDFSVGDFTNRNKIRTSQGWMWLTVPIKHPVRGTRIKDIEISGDTWRRKHSKSISQNYGKTERFDPEVLSFYERDYSKLCDLNTALIEWILGKLRIATVLVAQSSLGAWNLKGSQLLLEIVKAVGGDTYLSGKGASEYIEASIFAEGRVELTYQKFEHPRYRQCYEPFLPNMSIIDALFCEGEVFRRRL